VWFPKVWSPAEFDSAEHPGWSDFKVLTEDNRQPDGSLPEATEAWLRGPVLLTADPTGGQDKPRRDVFLKVSHKESEGNAQPHTIRPMALTAPNYPSFLTLRSEANEYGRHTRPM